IADANQLLGSLGYKIVASTASVTASWVTTGGVTECPLFLVAFKAANTAVTGEYSSPIFKVNRQQRNFRQFKGENQCPIITTSPGRSRPMVLPAPKIPIIGQRRLLTRKPLVSAACMSHLASERPAARNFA